MPKENEIVILDVDRAQVRARLRSLRAKYVGSYHYRRMEFLLSSNSRVHAWARVRTDGKKSTITLKEMRVNSRRVATDEYEVHASDFEKAVRIMSKLARHKPVYFENEREAYRLGGLEITIDKWPGIPYFVEIEGPSLAAVKSGYRRLRIGGNLVYNLTIEGTYARYGLSFRRIVAKDDRKLRRILASG